MCVCARSHRGGGATKCFDTSHPKKRSSSGVSSLIFEKYGQSHVEAHGAHDLFLLRQVFPPRLGKVLSGCDSSSSRSCSISCVRSRGPPCSSVGSCGVYSEMMLLLLLPLTKTVGRHAVLGAPRPTTSHTTAPLGSHSTFTK